MLFCSGYIFMSINIKAERKRGAHVKKITEVCTFHAVPKNFCTAFARRKKG